ncbi:MAG TPA: hypothetical protein VHL59_02395 [Thermoanaerobaculia bacterium]|nr:hypothetical protein [Thermoanaerobaculia bacterium]
MMIVRGRDDARWMPSRHRFALFRLAAYLRLRRAAPRPRPDVMIALTGIGDARENYGIAAWAALTVTCYVTSELPWPLILAIPAALSLAMLLLQAVIIASGLTARLFSKNENQLRFNGAVLGVALIAAAVYYARSASWVRFAAWQFLAFVALNALAAIVAFLLRDSIAKLEGTFAA